MVAAAGAAKEAIECGGQAKALTAQADRIKHGSLCDEHPELFRLLRAYESEAILLADI
jgi:hypothetical protein